VKWQPISEYNVEYGQVIVWLEWRTTAYKLDKTGQAYLAYQLHLSNNTNIWVEAKDCIPIETTGREVTHFCVPRSPDSGGEKHE
jgi:hypothetical protein